MAEISSNLLFLKSTYCIFRVLQDLAEISSRGPYIGK